MPSYANSTPEQLRARLHEVESELETAEPALFAEMQLLRRLLKAAEENTGLLEGIRSVIDAIEICLKTTGAMMTKQELVDMMSKGGFNLKPKTGKYLVADALNYHSKKSGRIVRKDDKFGLASWGSRR
jgi:hypothetical protein